MVYLINEFKSFPGYKTNYGDQSWKKSCLQFYSIRLIVTKMRFVACLFDLEPIWISNMLHLQ